MWKTKTFLLFMFVFSIVESTDIVFKRRKPKSCQISANKRGWCRPLNTCPSVAEEIKTKGITPTHCGFQDKMPIVCCPLSTDLATTNPSGRITLLEKVEAPKVDFECGQIEPSFTLHSPVVTKRRRSAPPTQSLSISVAGGIPSSRNAWPWMTLLLKDEKEGVGNPFCSGVLIHPDYVLTAAHCVLEADPFIARFGEHDFIASETIEHVGIRDVLFHPRFTLSHGYYDVALLRLNASVSFTNQKKPICLPWGTTLKEDLVGEEVTVTGWGKEEFGGARSEVLREVRVKIFEPSVCQGSYSTLATFFETYPQGFNRENIVCAGDEQGEKDACQGDSGGPMMHQRGNTFTLAGIISKGFGCGLKEFPGLYIPLKNYNTMEWIKNVVFQ